MTTTESTQKSGPPQKAGPPQIVKFDKALKLAEQWVNSMTGSADDEPIESELEGRPSRLGLGAKVARHSNYVPSNDPVARKLYSKLGVGKRKAAKTNDESDPNAKDEDDDVDEDDLESRTNVFTKKRAAPPAPPLQGKKKPK